MFLVRVLFRTVNRAVKLLNHVHLVRQVTLLSALVSAVFAALLLRIVSYVVRVLRVAARVLLAILK